MQFQSKVDLATILSPLDWGIVLASILLTLGIGWYAGLKRAAGATSIADWLIMGRRLTLPLFVMSLVSTWYGGIFGVTEIAYSSGIFNFVTQGFFWYGTYIFFALFLARRVAAQNVLTLPEMIAGMYGGPAGRVAAAFSFFNMLPVAYSLSLGIFVGFLTGLSLPLSILIGTGFVIAYSAFGGMRADVWTDAFQAVLMYLAVGAVVIFSLMTFGGWSWLRENLPASHFHPLGTHGLAQTLLWGFIALGTLVDPTFYQRCFAAGSEDISRRGILWATLFWMIFDIGTTASGMYARAVLPADVVPSESFLIYSLQILPDGLRGILVAGIIATIMSTVDSFNFVAATTINYDLVGEKTNFHRWRYVAGIVACGLASAGLALMFDGSVKAVWKTMGSYWAGCLVIPVLAGLFLGRKMRSRVFILSSTCAAMAITMWRWTDRSGIWADIDDLYVGLLVSGSLMWILQRLEPQAEVLS